MTGQVISPKNHGRPRAGVPRTGNGEPVHERAVTKEKVWTNEIAVSTACAGGKKSYVKEGRSQGKLF